MKTKTFLLLCLFMGIGLTQLSAQNGQDGATGSISERWSAPFSIPVFCDNQQIDMIVGTLEWHHIGKFLKGEWLHCYVQLFGEAESTNGSGEVFDVQLVAKQDNNIINEDLWEFVAYTHVNLKGNKGSHYIGSFIWYWTGEFVSIKAVCLENNL